MACVTSAAELKTGEVIRLTLDDLRIGEILAGMGPAIAAHTARQEYSDAEPARGRFRPDTANGSRGLLMPFFWSRPMQDAGRGFNYNARHNRIPRWEMRMKKTKKYLIFVLMAVLPVTVFAQEDDEGPIGFSYATYFYCDSGKAERADEIIKQVDAPIFDKAVRDGQINAWGWLAHHTGGQWRRAQYYTAPTLDALLDAQTAMEEARGDNTEELDAEFGSICRTHEDYIWEQLASGGSSDRGDAGFSVYYDCDESREERADEIFKEVYAPILNKFVEDGKFASWGWSSHWVGGQFRRLQTLTGPDHKSLLAARGELIEAMYESESAAGEVFTSICGSHADYMWNIQLETP